MSDEDRLVAQIVELLHTKRNSDEPFVLRPTELAALARPAPLQDDAALLRALTLAIKREARPPISQFSVRAQRVKRQTASFPLTFFCCPLCDDDDDDRLARAWWAATVSCTWA
jgi:hypothetical protein